MERKKLILQRAQNLTPPSSGDSLQNRINELKRQRKIHEIIERLLGNVDETKFPMGLQ